MWRDLWLKGPKTINLLFCKPNAVGNRVINYNFLLKMQHVVYGVDGSRIDIYVKIENH